MDYYEISKTASSQVSGHPGLEFLKHACQSAVKVLDVGCGEGTRLNTMLAKGARGWGIDPSSKAISKAKSQFPRHYFKIATGEKLPFASNTFDLVYSAFAIEHCLDPRLFIQEMVRVTKKDGQVVILAPNYGAPNRRSPVSTEIASNKLVQGTIKDLFPPQSLDWDQVTPKPQYDQIDDDTTWEPYVNSLARYLSSKHLTIQKISSLWVLEPPPQKLHHKLFSFLGKMGIYPFKYWGPQVFISALK